MAWRLEIDPRAFKELEALGKPDAARILKALYRLAQDPRAAANAKALQGEKVYRLRVGNYRAIYTLDNDRMLVLVVKIGHRREVYR